MPDNFYTDEINAKNKESRQEAQRRRDREIEDLRTLIKRPEGRRVLWRILETCGVFKASFSLNSVQTGFNEGKRDVGLVLLADLNEADTHVFAQMQSEYISELKSKKEIKKEET
jgi:hypothetical protein